MSDQPITIEYPETIYSLIETSCDDLPSIVVVNGALPKFTHREIFPWHLSVIITPRDLAEQGMPTADENTVLHAIGEEIDAGVIRNGNALFLSRETWNGQRQLLYRVHNPDVADTCLRELIALNKHRRDWEYRMERDEPWSLAERMLSLLARADESQADRSEQG